MSGAFLGLLRVSPRWGGISQPDKGSRGEEDLRRAESGRRNPSPRDADCGHHVSRGQQFSPSAPLTAVTRPPGRAPESARRPAPPRPFLPACGQSGVGPRRCPAPARCARRAERRHLSAHDSAASRSLLFSPLRGLACGRSPRPSGLEWLAGLGLFEELEARENHSEAPPNLPAPPFSHIPTAYPYSHLK